MGGQDSASEHCQKVIFYVQVCQYTGHAIVQRSQRTFGFKKGISATTLLLYWLPNFELKKKVAGEVTIAGIVIREQRQWHKLTTELFLECNDVLCHDQPGGEWWGNCPTQCLMQTGS